MSVVFDLKKLDNDISNKIAKILTFTPKNNLQKFQKFSSYTPSEEKIRMYYTTEGVTHLPYYFSCMFFKKKFHLDKKYPNIYEDPNGKFTGKLLDRQKEPFKEAIKYFTENTKILPDAISSSITILPRGSNSLKLSWAGRVKI